MIKLIKKLHLRYKLEKIHKVMGKEGAYVRDCLRNKDYDKAGYWNFQKKCSAKAIRNLLDKYNSV